MSSKKTLTEEKVRNAIANGEFDTDVISSADTVVVVMTQDWCPQWHDVRSWIYGAGTSKPLDIYEIVYNKEPYFEEFMRFKETVWNSFYVPYLRFYKKGKLVKETNHISRAEFDGIVN